MLDTPRFYEALTHLRPSFVGSACKKLLRIKRRVVNTEYGSFYIDPASNLGITILRQGVYEPPMIEALKFFLARGSTFIDVGSNEGYFSVAASSIVGDTGKVCAVEPQSRLISTLQRNLALNECQNVTVIEAAISDRSGSATLHLSPDTNTGASSLVLPFKYPVATQTVKTITLEEMFDSCNIQECALMKMDIEGFEHEAILGSPELFTRRRIRALALEPHDRLLKQRGLSSEEIFDFLRACGYQLDQRFENNSYRTVWTQN